MYNIFDYKTKSGNNNTNMSKGILTKLLISLGIFVVYAIIPNNAHAYVIQESSCTSRNVDSACSTTCGAFFAFGAPGFTCDTLDYSCTSEGLCDCNCSEPEVTVECTTSDSSACSSEEQCILGVCVPDPSSTCVPDCSSTTQCPAGNGGTCNTSGETPTCECFTECSPGNNYTCNDECDLGGNCEADGTCSCATESIFCTDSGCDDSCGTGYTGYCIDNDGDSNNGEEYCLCIRGEEWESDTVNRPSYQGPLIEYGTLIKTLFTFLLPIAIGVFGLPLLAINGYKIMTSKGDPAKYQDGIEGLVSVIIGLIFVLLAISLIRILMNSFLGLNILA